MMPVSSDITDLSHYNIIVQDIYAKVTNAKATKARPLHHKPQQRKDSLAMVVDYGQAGYVGSPVEKVHDPLKQQNQDKLPAPEACSDHCSVDRGSVLYEDKKLVSHNENVNIHPPLRDTGSVSKGEIMKWQQMKEGCNGVAMAMAEDKPQVGNAVKHVVKVHQPQQQQNHVALPEQKACRDDGLVDRGPVSNVEKVSVSHNENMSLNVNVNKVCLTGSNVHTKDVVDLSHDVEDLGNDFVSSNSHDGNSKASQKFPVSFVGMSSPQCKRLSCFVVTTYLPSFFLILLILLLVMISHI